MANTEIQEAFIQGIQEVYSTMFTDGVNDGVYFYPFYEGDSSSSIYEEQRFKAYNTPILLVSKVELTPQVGVESVETLKNKASFTIPYKDLTDKGIDINLGNLDYLRRGVMKYKDTFFGITMITPKVFVEDTFMAYTFECEEDTELNDSNIVINEEEQNV